MRGAELFGAAADRGPLVPAGHSRQPRRDLGQQLAHEREGSSELSSSNGFVAV
jgi:hypothetical protein